MGLFQKIRRKYYKLRGMRDPKEVYGYKHPTAKIPVDATIYSTENLYVDEDAGFLPGALIMNPRSKFILKKHSGASHNLTVVPGNHLCLVGKWKNDITDKIKDELIKDNEYDKDIVVDEDVWMGVNVTLMNGVHIGRGCIIGGGSVVRNSTPPYSIVLGNPAKVVGFVFTPEEIVAHEKMLYPENERLPIELLENNYNKFFINRIADIKQFTRL